MEENKLIEIVKKQVKETYNSFLSKKENIENIVCVLLFNEDLDSFGIKQLRQTISEEIDNWVNENDIVSFSNLAEELNEKLVGKCILSYREDENEVSFIIEKINELTTDGTKSGTCIDTDELIVSFPQSSDIFQSFNLYENEICNIYSFFQDSRCKKLKKQYRLVSSNIFQILREKMFEIFEKLKEVYESEGKEIIE